MWGGRGGEGAGEGGRRRWSINYKHTQRIREGKKGGGGERRKFNQHDIIEVLLYCRLGSACLPQYSQFL